MSAQLIPVVSGQINGRPAFVVDGRLLHARLEPGRDFPTWIRSRIQEYGYQEKQDFEVFEVFPQMGENPQGGRPAKEFRLSLGMAKELAMVERTEKGRMVRRYFIECEARMYGQIAQLARLRALVFELKPEYGVLVRCRKAGLTRLQTARALGWGEKRVRGATRVLADAGLLPARESMQLSLLGG